MSSTSYNSAGLSPLESARAARPIPLSRVNTPASFRRVVWDFYRRNGRHDLPWRKTHDPYRILVSEVMLQQTQVERVVPFYKEFIKKFPTVKKLAAAPLAEVLKSWQGLGYNRRAKMLHAATKETVARGGTFPRNVAELESLSGVGPYTARAVAAFAFNQDVIFIETNIRTAVINAFFVRGVATSSSRSARAARPIPHLGKDAPVQRVSDREIEMWLAKLLPKGRSREWYSALMDYGAHLKRSGVKLNEKSKHYTKQSKFAGSNREARGAILRELARGAAAAPRLLGLLGDDRVGQLRAALAALLSEKLVEKDGSRYRLPA